MILSFVNWFRRSNFKKLSTATLMADQIELMIQVLAESMLYRKRGEWTLVHHTCKNQQAGIFPVNK